MVVVAYTIRYFFLNQYFCHHLPGFFYIIRYSSLLMHTAVLNKVKGLMDMSLKIDMPPNTKV